VGSEGDEPKGAVREGEKGGDAEDVKENQIFIVIIVDEHGDTHHAQYGHNNGHRPIL